MDQETYIAGHIDPEGDYLHALWRATQLHSPYGQMASGHIQGRLLKMFVRMIRPRFVLELGTFSGYSALCMAEGLEGDAQLHTFEVFDEQEDFIRKWFQGSPYAERLHLHIGDALELVPKMDVQWDLAFVDADKRQYIDYYEMLLPRMRKGGFILAEDRQKESDLQTRGIMEFNEMVAADNRVEKVILPVRDGLTIIRLK